MFTCPPLPGENLLTPAELAQRANASREFIYSRIKDRRLAAVTVGGRLLIAESEAERFLCEWPSKNRGVSARWAEFRAWKAAGCAA
jgi:excisionase family DNA binding protein